MQLPTFFIFRISWKEINPKYNDIYKFFICLPLNLKTNSLFTVYNSDLSKSYDLYGFIGYSEGQYICFFKVSYMWCYLNDDTVITLKSIKEVIIQCININCRPIILFYSLSAPSLHFAFDDLQPATLSDKDCAFIYEYCKNLDNEITDDQSADTKRKSSQLKLRPTLTLKKITDIHLVKSIQNLQKAEKKKKKEEEEKELQNEYEKIEEEVKKGIKKNEWICDYEGCGNINKNTIHQCSKCKNINIRIYNLIMSKKQKKSKIQINVNNSNKLFQTLNKSFMPNKVVESNNKKTQSNKISKLFQNEDSNQNYIESINKNAVVFQINDDLSWKCPKCNYRNENGIQYCEKCLINIPINGSTVNIEECPTMETINGIKHYI